jgi:hypothetical protein
LEREADRVAEQVMRMTSSPEESYIPIKTLNDIEINRKCKSCEEEEELENIKIDRKENNVSGDDAVVSNNVTEDIINVVGEEGSPIDLTTREFMEKRFGCDFDEVRIHINKNASRSAKLLNALAYTVGNEIVFEEGHYSPFTNYGRKLLAHELTHVIQQKSRSVYNDNRSEASLQINEPNLNFGTTAKNHLQSERTNVFQVTDKICRQASPDAGVSCPSYLSPDACRIINIAKLAPHDDSGAKQVVMAIVKQYYSNYENKINDIKHENSGPYNPDGKKVKVTGLLTQCTTGKTPVCVIFVSDYFLNNITFNRGAFARRVIQIGHEMDHIDQHVGSTRITSQDEREFLAFYNESLAVEKPGTGMISHSMRATLIDSAMGYYHCLEKATKLKYNVRFKELEIRRKKEIDEYLAKGYKEDLGQAPSSCRRQ